MTNDHSQTIIQAMIQLMRKEDASTWILSAGIAAASAFIPLEFLRDAMRTIGEIVLTKINIQYLLPGIPLYMWNIISIVLTALILTFPLRVKNSLLVGSGILALTIPAMMLLLCEIGKCSSQTNESIIIIFPLYGVVVTWIYLVKEYIELTSWKITILVGIMPFLIFGVLSLLVTSIIMAIFYGPFFLYLLLPFIPGILLLAFALTSQKRKTNKKKK